jgi:hypothetical protein
MVQILQKFHSGSRLQTADRPRASMGAQQRSQNMNMKMIHVSAQLSDTELLAEVKKLAEHERVATADLIATLAELDARRLYLGEGCSSLFCYCTHVLHLSEHAAYGRIEAARAARRHPVILDMLAAGLVNLTTVCLLASHQTTPRPRFAPSHDSQRRSRRHFRTRTNPAAEGGRKARSLRRRPVHE